MNKIYKTKLTAYKVFIFIINCFLFLLSSFTTYAQVGVGTNSPNTQAALDVSSTTKAFILPRLSTSQRDANITQPVAGMLIYNTTTGKFQGYAGAGAAGTIAINTDGTTGIYIDNTEYPAQTFQVSQSTSSFSISFWVYQLHNSFTSGDITFELYSGTPGGSTTLLNSQQAVINSTGQKTFTISGISISTSTTYFFLVKPTTSFSTGWISLTRSGTGGNPYANGAIYLYMNGSWSSGYSDDLKFEVTNLGATWVDLH